MDHTIFVHGSASAVIRTHETGVIEVTAYVQDVPSVAWEAPSDAEAERWGKAVIAYPSHT